MGADHRKQVTGSGPQGYLVSDPFLSLSLLALYEMKLLPPTCSHSDDFLKTWLNMNISFLGVFPLVPLSQLQNANWYLYPELKHPFSKL